MVPSEDLLYWFSFFWEDHQWHHHFKQKMILNRICDWSIGCPTSASWRGGGNFSLLLLALVRVMALHLWIVSNKWEFQVKLCFEKPRREQRTYGICRSWSEGPNQLTILTSWFDNCWPKIPKPQWISPFNKDLWPTTVFEW
jgi:hypothetical protein